MARKKTAIFDIELGISQYQFEGLLFASSGVNEMQDIALNAIIDAIESVNDRENKINILREFSIGVKNHNQAEYERFKNTIIRSKKINQEKARNAGKASANGNKKSQIVREVFVKWCDWQSGNKDAYAYKDKTNKTAFVNYMLNVQYVGELDSHANLMDRIRDWEKGINIPDSV